MTIEEVAGTPHPELAELGLCTTRRALAFPTGEKAVALVKSGSSRGETKRRGRKTTIRTKSRSIGLQSSAPGVATGRSPARNAMQ